MSSLEKLGNLISFRTGKLNSNAAVVDGAYPFFTCSQETYRTSTCSFNTECVLLAGNNANGIYPLKYFKGKFDAYQRTYVFEPLNKEQLETRYLYFALRPQLEHLRSISTGAATKFLTLTILREIEIACPPIGVQRHIASILSAYDDLIENNTRRIAILEEMARRLYEEWFVHFRFPGCEQVRMVESDLGLIPEGWEVATVDDTFDLLGGGTPSRVVPEYWEGGTINWYSPTDLTRAGSAFMDCSGERITALGLAKSSARLFPPYSVMMTSRATLGVIAVNTTEACTNQGFITCLPNAKFPLWMLYQWLKANVETFISLGTGATFKEITKGVFRTIKLAIPPENISSDYQTLAEPMMGLILRLQRKNTNLRAQRDLLLPKLISGEINVSAFPEPEAVAA